MGAVEPAGALSHPDQVGGGVVPVPSQRVPPGHGLLEAEDESFVARPEVHLLHGRLVAQVESAGPHEAQGPVDLGRQHLVVLAARAGGDELLVPDMHLRQVGEASLRERPQQVERRRRLVVGGEHPGRIGRSAGLARGVVVDDVAAEAGQYPTVDDLGR